MQVGAKPIEIQGCPSAMLPSKNCAAERRKFTVPLRIIRSACQVSEDRD